MKRLYTVTRNYWRGQSCLIKAKDEDDAIERAEKDGVFEDDWNSDEDWANYQARKENE